MFERFTNEARDVVMQAQSHARRLGHGYIGCEHLLMGAASTTAAASDVLREHGVTPERIEMAIMRTASGREVAPPGALDADALAAIGIDLDVVRARIEAAFGPGALNWATPGAHPARRRRLRRPLRRPARDGRGPSAGPPRGHIPFTPRAKKTLELSLRAAVERHDNYIGVEHIVMALIGTDGTVPNILASLDVPKEVLRAAINERFRKAS